MNKIILFRTKVSKINEIALIAERGRYLQNKVIKNTAWIIGCKIIQSILGLIISMISARYLGPSNYGIINYAASITAFMLPIVQLGFRSILVQEIVNDPEKEGETIGTSLFFCTISSFVCVIGVSTFVYIANPSEPVTLIVCILYSFSLFAQALEMIQYWFQSKLISQYTSLVGLAAYIIVTVYKVYLLVTQKSIYWFAITHVLDFFIIAIVLLWFYHKLNGQKLSVSVNRFKMMFSKSKYFIVSSMMVTIFGQMDKIMLKSMVSEEAVGIYAAATTCAGMTGFVFAAIIDSARPSVFENRKQSKESYEKSLTVCYSVIIYLSLAQSLLFSIFSKLIIQLMYGSQYAAAADVLSLIVWQMTFSYLGPVRNIWILAENKQKYMWIINMSGALINVVLNMVMIPFMGATGAALASLVTQIFTNVFVGFIIKPIRYNNALMLKGCNPKILIDFAKQIIKRRKGLADV